MKDRDRRRRRQNDLLTCYHSFTSVTCQHFIIDREVSVIYNSCYCVKDMSACTFLCVLKLYRYYMSAIFVCNRWRKAFCGGESSSRCSMVSEKIINSCLHRLKTPSLLPSSAEDFLSPVPVVCLYRPRLLVFCLRRMCIY